MVERDPGSQRPVTQGSTGSVCPSCGWPNPKSAARCEFCKAPLAPEPRAQPRERKVRCPHCSEESVGVDPLGRCPVCRWGYLERPTPFRKLVARLRVLSSGLHVSPFVIVVGSLVGVGLVGLVVNLSGQNKVVTADHMRQIKQRLEIFEGENGGFPANLEALQQRYGPIPESFRRDAWGNEIRYEARVELGANQESGFALYGSCELRSAGSNRRFGDTDDVVWRGTATR